jgi:hypothetical protein
MPCEVILLRSHKYVAQHGEYRVAGSVYIGRLGRCGSPVASYKSGGLQLVVPHRDGCCKSSLRCPDVLVAQQ